MQAVMSSDIAIAQFRYLERLLLVHGHWCYSRITSMVKRLKSFPQKPPSDFIFISIFLLHGFFAFLQICYFFYKNITFGVTVFLYEAYSSFSGQPAYNDWFLSLFNVFFSSLPVIALGVFDQDVSARFCYKVHLGFKILEVLLVSLKSTKLTYGFFVSGSFRCYTKKVCRTFSSAGKGL